MPHGGESIFPPSGPSLILFSREGETAESIVHRMRYHKPAAPFRKAFIYSNDNYALAGEFIAKLTGIPYIHFVKKNILDPLGMSDTQYDHEGASATGRRVEGFIHYGHDGDQRREALEKGDWTQICVGEVGETRFWDSQDGLFFAAAGGLWTTGTDIVCVYMIRNPYLSKA
jgi:CubicO group peptidase (beta-lactamase class C family)